MEQVVQDLTTPTSQTTANPDGTFTQVQSLLPTRVAAAGGWVPVDATLQTGADGMIHPVAAPTDVAFSAGGSGPLVQVTDAGGRSLTITYPTALPQPVLSGATATYPEVMPGVDLVVTATDGGGFSEVLAVKTPAAATNPALKSINFAVKAPGLQITDDPTTGALHGTDSSNMLQFTAPTPLMWDSTVANPSSPGSPGAPPPDPSDGSAPGEQAKTAVVDATVGAPTTSAGETTQTLSVKPDQGVLGSSATVYPVYIDPYFSARGDRQNFTWVQSGCPNVSNYNSQSAAPGVGYNNYAGCIGVERALFQLDTQGLANTVVNSATLQTSVTHTAKGCPAPAYSATATYVGGFSAQTTWNAQPGVVTGTDADSNTQNVTHCADTTPVNVNFDVTKSIRTTVRNGATSVNYQLTGNEGDAYAFMRFANNPILTTVYDRTPNVPTGLGTDPAPVNTWIGATNAATPVSLSATVSSPIGGQVVYGVFTLTDTTTGATPLNAARSTENAVTSGTVHHDTPVLTNGHDYSWSVYTSDGILSSAAANGSAFGVDTTPPTMGTISSASYPPSGSATQTTLHAGSAGTFTLNATDDHSGVSRIDWQLSPLATGNPPANNSVGGSKAFPAGTTSATATATGVTPSRWGTNTLFVRVIDQAGNTSQTKQYSFYVPANPASTPTLGDIDGDHTPDIITTTPDGRLRVYPSDKDPGVVVDTNTVPSQGPYIASPKAVGPGGSWSGTILTHRGSFDGAGTVDDVFAWKTFNATTATMTLYLNDGSGHFNGNQSVDVPHFGCDSNCSDCPGDWSSLTAMVAPGHLTSNSPYDLITIENKKIWLYPGGKLAGLNAAIGLTLTGPGLTPIDAAHSDLIAPGDVDHDGHPDLWIRDRVTGTITQFLGTATGLSTTGTLKGTGYTKDSAATLYSGGDFLHDTTSPGAYVPSLVALTPAGALQLSETPAAAASQIATGSFGATVAAVENQTVAPTRNVYVPLSPTRLVDTRGNQNGGTLTTSARRAWTVTGTAGVPATGVTAVAVSVTGLNASQSTWLRFGDNGPGTATSTINLPAGVPVANSAIVVPDAQGQISAVLGGGGTADVLIDVVGYYTDQADATTAGVTGSYYVPLAGSRVCDSRASTGNAPGCGKLPAATIRTVTIAGSGGVPAGATAVTVNITTPSSPSTSALVAWAAGQPQPGTTSLHPIAGQSSSATAQVQLSAAGQLLLYSSVGTQDVILDVQGYYLPTTTTPPAGASTYVPIPAARILNTNDPGLSGTSAAPLAAGATRTLKITGATDSNGNPVAPPTGACAAALQIAVVSQGSPGYLQVGPRGVTVPTSALNYPATPARTNLVISKLSADGSIDIHNGGSAPTDLIVDLIGYLTPQNGTC
ncbi:hypothetical protein [Lapillicoccus sp.]|uniref:hypothetical protein n=1 Tax=Lapillicoccus sp. TaxID=1909287 RepID=UPI0025DDCF43|nr:hypothetical protein [Lapillicoccus sp.]